MTQIVERHIGGEDGRRGFWGGRSASKTRKWGLVASVLTACVLVLALQAVGVAIGAVLFLTVWVSTLRTGNQSGSLMERKVRDHREKQLIDEGFDLYRPVHRRPESLQDPVQGRAAKKSRYREYNSYRDWPDGLVGLQWLQEGSPGRPPVLSTAEHLGRSAVAHTPGIAWQVDPDAGDCLTVVFPLGGQIRGMEPDRAVNMYCTRFGDVITSMGANESRTRRLQMLTRVLPPDSAGHEQWAVEELDADAPAEAIQSYADVVHTLNARGYVQRHYVIGRWNCTPEFTRAAARRGPGAQGWIRLMDNEIAAMGRRLDRAGMNPGHPLTARQVAAVFRHLQMPSWPIDKAGDIDNPMQAFLEEKSFHDHTVVTDTGPNGDTQQWYHATARVPVDAVETGPRTPLWLLPILTGVSTNVIRSVSFEHEVIPAAQARPEARQDLSSDLANLYKASKDGAMAQDELKAAKKAVESRVKDLEPGSGQHGDDWCLHLTVSATSRNGLTEAIEAIQDAADNCGINELMWLDGWGQTAHATTFPVCRALKPYKPSRSVKVMKMLSGKGRKNGVR